MVGDCPDNHNERKDINDGKHSTHVTTMVTNDALMLATLLALTLHGLQKR
jgi:hypothetical protein